MKKKQVMKNGRTSEKDALILSAATGSAYAVRESKALGLTIKLIAGNKIIEKLPSGKINIIRIIDHVSVTERKLKKGTVLFRKAK